MLKNRFLTLGLSLLVFHQSFATEAEIGLATFYADKFHGRQTSSGRIFNQEQNVAAHRTLPFGTFVRVTNLHNNKKTIVKIIDRGPHTKKRIIDLSSSAAEEIEMINRGVAKVKLEVIGKPEDYIIFKYLNPELSQLTYDVGPPKEIQLVQVNFQAQEIEMKKSKLLKQSR